MHPKLLRLLLSDDPKRRGALTIWTLAAVNYLLFSVVQLLEVHFGFMDERASTQLIVAMLGSAALFYGLIRSGVAQRFGPDPQFSMTQLTFGCAITLWSYAVTGPARGAILGLLVGTFVYCVFSFTERHARQLALAALIGLAGVMVWCSNGDPAGYPWRVELVHFLFTAIVLAGTSRLSGRLSMLRASLGGQSRELKTANERLQLLATRDPLTQAHNRRHMTELIAEAQRQHERRGSPMCLALLDIDLFKGINDRFGHNAGDQVLQHVVKVAQGCLRGADLLARWGGEEFLLLFPDTLPEPALAALQRLHGQMGDQPITLQGQPLRITFSAGLGAFAPGESLEAAVERVDQAMYRAKSGGRDRSCLAAADAPAGPISGSTAHLPA